VGQKRNHNADNAAAKAKRVSFHSGSIVLVEDDADDIELTMRALKRNGFNNHVITLRDGAQALDYLRHEGNYAESDDPPPALILLDLKLPRLDGLEVLGEIKSDPTLRALPIVMLTSSRQERDISEAYKLGVNSYISKPSDFSELLKVVNTLGRYWFATVELPPENLTRRRHVQ
jgi:CheY-like chemotaxis protein